MRRSIVVLSLLAMLLVMLAFLPTAQAQETVTGKTAVAEKGFWDFIKAGGLVGYTIIALSVLSTGLVIDSFVHIRQIKLLPEGLIEQAESLARKGRFSEMLTMCKANDSLLSRVLSDGLSQGNLGLTSVRQAMQDRGLKEFSRLNQRVGYMGFIGSIGPMLGLLGTVLGMVSSFNVLGTSKGAARPDELASGISYALVTTCEGLVLAIPMMFFYNFFRDRLTKLSQECSSICERFFRLTSMTVEQRSAKPTTNSAPASQQGAAKSSTIAGSGPAAPSSGA